LNVTQALLKIGFVKGSGVQYLDQEGVTKSPNPYYITDGLRAVLVFGKRPVTLDEIDFFEWEELGESQPKTK
jgi:hypothetical protein